ncbi:hypothetical protein CEXT_177281 [Caerostris extrusa]|uniref:Uncharacterized protein n=1 Tax=Caerostris extrusa TaxID=172846 RepID=A0AAV4X7G9_CAEEX|nr:hypothetical protein CEXT_177281 [Caerostris extrusa]
MLTTFQAFLSCVAQASREPENKPIEASAPLKCVGSLQLMRCLKAILKILNVLQRRRRRKSRLSSSSEFRNRKTQITFHSVPSQFLF